MNIFRRLISLLFAVTLILAVPGTSSGGGILHVFPPKLQEQSVAVARPAVLVSKANVTVSESFIEYRIDQTFSNDNDFPLTGVFFLPMEENVPPQALDIRMDGVPYPAEVMSQETFFPVLRELTTSMKDPSLMGLAGRTVAVVRPIQIGIRGQKSVRCQFKIPVSMEKDLLDLSLPLDGERYSLGPVGELEISVRMKMDRPVRNIFSPTHNLTITRETPQRCLAFARSAEKKVRDDFRLISSSSGQDPDLRVLTHRLPGKKGTFMAMISPPMDLQKNKEPEKDVVFLLDSAKSMGSSEFTMAKRAIVSGLQRLGPGDRFNIMIIDTRPRFMSDRLVTISEETVAQAVRFVNATPEGGGTDLYNTLINALDQFTTRRRLGVVVLVGNGRGTVGITSPETIIEDIRRNNKFRARIFTLGLGRHMDVAVLDSLASSSKGVSMNRLGQEDFDTLLNRFYAGVSPPQMSEISLDFQDLSTEEVEPEPIPDQLGTGSVIVLGRYSEARDTPCKVRLKARIEGRQRTLTSTVVFPQVDRDNSFLPGLWAMRRVARLLEREWLKGPDSEYRGPLSALAKEFGFKLPSQAAQYEGPQQRRSSDILWRLKTSFSQSDVEAEGFRNIEGKIMRLSPKGVWVDSEYHSSLETRVIGFLSDEYFSVVRDSPKLGAFMSIGSDLILVRKQEALRVKSELGSNAP